MSRLRNKNSKKCLLVLRQFIEGSQPKGRERETAILALDQLQRITAGFGPRAAGKDLCIGRPLAESS